MRTSTFSQPSCSRAVAYRSVTRPSRDSANLRAVNNSAPVASSPAPSASARPRAVPGHPGKRSPGRAAVLVREPVASWHQHHPCGRWCQPHGGDPAERPSDAPLRGSPPLHHVQDVRDIRPPSRTFSATMLRGRFRRSSWPGTLGLHRRSSYRPARCPCRTPAGTAVGKRTGWMPLPLSACPRGSRPWPRLGASPAALPGVPPGAPRDDAHEPPHQISHRPVVPLNAPMTAWPAQPHAKESAGGTPGL